MMTINAAAPPRTRSSNASSIQAMSLSQDIIGIDGTSFLDSSLTPTVGRAAGSNGPVGGQRVASAGQEATKVLTRLWVL